MTFDEGATDVDTAPAEAFAAGRGVCQDYAHVLIGALRALGVPAGYVSGAIRTTPPPGRARLQGADAMHAWVMAWCGEWVELDPTNDREAGLDHVVVARGRDYGDVAPIRGVLRTAGAQAARHAVDLVPVGQAGANDRATPFMQ
jgi:transglutaminase-like putative cysteine protease